MVAAAPPPAASRPLGGRCRLQARSLAEWLVAALLCAGFAAVATWYGWLWRLDELFYDTALAVYERPADGDVVIVAIDGRSLAEIGRWPWPRGVHAALVERLREAGARAIALDLIFHEPDPRDPAGDRALAEAIAAHGRVVLPVTHAVHGAGSGGEALPAPLFATAAAALGHIQIELDPDGIARTVYLWEGLHQARHPQLGLALLSLVEPDRAARYAAPGAPPGPDWHRADWLHIPYLGPPGSFRYVSYVDVLRGVAPADTLKDAVVFVGATAEGMGDVVPTPSSGYSRPMPGVEVNATVFSALRRGDAIVPVPTGQVAVLAAFVVCLLLAVMARAGARFTLVAAFAFSAAIPLVSGLALILAHRWLPPAGALVGCMLAYPLWSWRRLEAAQQYLDAELSALLADREGLAAPPPLDPAVPVTIDRFRSRIAVVREVARRERALQRFVADTLEGLPVGVAVADRAGRVVLANQRIAELLGASGHEALREQLVHLPWPAGTPLIAGLPMPPDSRRPLTLEVDPPGGPALLVTVRTLADAEGAPRGAVIGLADIGAVRAAQRSREETMHFLSHDLRAPLASILTLVDAQRAEGAGDVPDSGAVEQRIARYARSALSLADNLVRLVRAEGVDPAGFSELALEMLAQDAADDVWALARSKDVRLVLDLGPEDAEPRLVRGDGDLLCRALVNLLTNAIKYSPAGGEVRLSLAAEAGGWAVSVSDSGVGIEPEHMPRLFQRFGRVPTSANRRVDGVGLGLRMVHAVAERHGGSISVQSRLGAGSTFTLYLPAAPGTAGSSVEEGSGG